MFYKVIKDKEVVDALDRLQYVRMQTVNDTLICCEAQYAQGILGSNGEDKWYISGYVAGENINGYPEVELVETDESEYSEIRAVLDEGRAIYEPESGAEEPESGAEEPENGAEEPQAKTIGEKIRELSETIDMLTECIMEMSGVVYG